MTKIPPFFLQFKPVFALFRLLFSHVACAQKTPESTSPETWGDQLVAAIQSTSAAERETIVLRIFSDAALTNPGKERLLAFIDRLQSEFNPLEYHHSDLMAVELSPGNISRVLHIYLRKKDASMWRDIQMRLDPLPPYKLLNIAFIAEVAEPVSLPNGDKGWKEAKHGKRGSPAGGGYSTLRDMLLFSKGLKNNAFVSVESF